jgi:hypothetical protein
MLACEMCLSASSLDEVSVFQGLVILLGGKINRKDEEGETMKLRCSNNPNHVVFFEPATLTREVNNHSESQEDWGFPNGEETSFYCGGCGAEAEIVYQDDEIAHCLPSLK